MLPPELVMLTPMRHAGESRADEDTAFLRLIWTQAVRGTTKLVVDTEQFLALIRAKSALGLSLKPCPARGVPRIDHYCQQGRHSGGMGASGRRKIARQTSWRPGHGGVLIAQGHPQWKKRSPSQSRIIRFPISSIKVLRAIKAVGPLGNTQGLGTQRTATLPTSCAASLFPPDSMQKPDIGWHTAAGSPRLPRIPPETVDPRTTRNP